MNYLFLDVDGVIRLDKEKDIPLFDRKSLINLKEICLKTKCKIALTSDWQNNEKYMRNLIRVLNVLGLKISTVVPGSYNTRGQNIMTFIDANPCDNYMVIDDDIDIIRDYIDKKHYVITHSMIGITDEIKNEVIQVLGESYDMDNRICR